MNSHASHKEKRSLWSRLMGKAPTNPGNPVYSASEEELIKRQLVNGTKAAHEAASRRGYTLHPRLASKARFSNQDNGFGIRTVPDTAP